MFKDEDMLRVKQTIKTPILFIRFVIFVLFALLATTSYAVAGSISGTVTDNAGNPLQNVSVNLYNKSGNNWANAGNTQTDDEGNYNFSGLPSGDYRVKYKFWGYATE